MIIIIQFIACFFGFTGILLGAFGAHLLKKRFTPELMASFETGVKYQMYHAIVLLIIGFNLDFDSTLDSAICIFFVVGTILFSFSIYGLCLTAASGKKWKWLGPVTPLGGLCLMLGWLLLGHSFIEDLF